jgi:hypothetical protein
VNNVLDVRRAIIPLFIYEIVEVGGAGAARQFTALMELGCGLWLNAPTDVVGTWIGPVQIRKGRPLDERR